MEKTVNQWPCIRRLPGGVIDYDFYRRIARTQRIAAIADFFAPRRRSGLLTILTVLLRLRAAWKS
jgi:hypothetical protein